MKWVSIFAVLLSAIFTGEARPSHRGHRGYSHYSGAGWYGQERVGRHGYRSYFSEGYYGQGGYPYSYAYSGLYSSGIYHRPFPYYSYYSGAYPYLYNSGYRSGAYTIYSSVYPNQAGSQVIQIYQYRPRANDLEDVDKTWAWGYLAEGNFNRASAIFAAMERQTPGVGWPKIGTGLLAGFSGDHGKALYQFRRAFRFDPTDPGRLPTQQELQDKIQRLSNHFKKVANNGRRSEPDAEFMVAALSYLMGDSIGAQNAIEKAVMHGDKSRSARNLKELVDDALQQRNNELLASETP